jgi:hypothetical protein
MSTSLSFSILFHGYWHIGSGYGGGARCDDLMRKDRHGLPLLPGRTLHGHLREATQTLEDMKQVLPGTTERVFGEWPQEPDQDPETIRSRACKPGCLIVDNGVLPASEADWLRMHDAERKRLYRILRNTAIDNNGVARNNTLRTAEVCVPVTLQASVQLLEDGKCDAARVIETLRTACRLICRIGMGRHRGLGRCTITLDAPAALPMANRAAPAATTGGKIQ